MKKNFIIFILFLLFILTFSSCNIKEDKNSNRESELYTLTRNILYHNYSTSVFEFTQITKILSQDNNIEIEYVKGRIDGYMNFGVREFNFINSYENRSNYPVLNSEDRIYISGLLSDMYKYIRTLQININGEKDIHKIINQREDRAKISNLSKELNINLDDLNDKNFEKEYLAKVSLVRNLINKVNGE